MTDVQVSNARRIGFTALALVAFWVVAWRAYGWGLAQGPVSGAVAVGGGPWNTAVLYDPVLDSLASLASLCFTFLPAILLSFALYDLRDIWKLVRELRVDHRDWRMLISIILFIVSIEVCYRLGESDASAEHEVSWPWLLLPIILTTAFVIFGAWRRAVRDAEVDAVGEDESQLTGD